MAPNETASGAIDAALYVNDRFSKLYSNAVEQPEVTGLHLKMEAIPERRTAVMESARLSRQEARRETRWRLRLRCIRTRPRNGCCGWR